MGRICPTKNETLGVGNDATACRLRYVCLPTYGEFAASAIFQTTTRLPEEASTGRQSAVVEIDTPSQIYLKFLRPDCGKEVG